MMNQEAYSDLISQGIVLMSSEKYEAAVDLFQKARSIEPKSSAAYIHLGNAYVNLDRYNDGIAEFKKALILEPKNGNILYSIGSAYLLMDDRLKTVEYYNKAEEAGFKNPDMYQLLAVTFFESNDSIQALRNINRAIALSPLDGQLRLFKANVYMADGKYEEALQTLDEMNKILPDAFEAYSIRADIYCSMKDYKKALEVCEQGCDRFPEDANLTVIKLRILVESGSYDEALALAEEMKKNGQYDKVKKQAVLQEAAANAGKGDAEKAISLLDSAAKELDDDEDILFVEMSAAAAQKMYEKIFEIAEKLIAKSNNNSYLPSAKYYKALSLESQGKAEEAQAEYKKLTSEFRKLTINEPARYEIYIFRLLCHTKIKEYDKALELAEYLENVKPESTDAYAFRYYIYKEMGNMELAEKEKEKVRQIDPDMKL